MRRPTRGGVERLLAAHNGEELCRSLALTPGDERGIWQALAAGAHPRGIAGLAVAAAASAAPGLCLKRLLELAAVLPIPPERWGAAGRRALAIALGGSDAVARYLRSRPGIAMPIIRDEFLRAPKPLAIMRRELRQRRAAAKDEDELRAALQRYRVREWVRITARELARLDEVTVIIAELSDLAEAIIDTATRFHLRRERSRHGPRNELPGARPAGFTVIAQGKLGGRELNLSSDVDLQFFYSSDDTSPGQERSLHERFASVARRITQTLSTPSADGFCYRVDLDLRPEGTKGPVVNSITGAENYYQAWGHGWERVALVRARHVGGSRWVSHALIAAVRPFTFPRHLDASIIDEIRGLVRREQQARRARALARGRPPPTDIKRDPGGIRELELFVHILQVLNGGRDRALREPALLAAIEQLRFTGHLRHNQATALTQAYGALRRFENALQAVDDRQTHTLPREAPARDHLARLLKLRTSPERFVIRQQQAVRRTIAPLFAAEQQQDGAPHRLAKEALAPEPTRRAAALEALGFTAPTEAANGIAVLERAAGGPFSPRSPERIRDLGVLVLDELAHSPDPDQALRLFVDLDTQLRRQPTYYGLLENVPARRRLIDLLGTSELLGRTIVHHPELIDWLAQAKDTETLGHRLPVSELQHRAATRIDSLRRQGGDLELALRSLRRFRLQEQLRIGILDLAGTLEIEPVLAQLSDVAIACLRIACDLSAESLGLATEGFAVLGLGSLGGLEMGYGSDLDLIFIYDDRFGAGGGNPSQSAARLAQRLIQQITHPLPEGRLYAIDTRLRPSGNQGPLVSSRTGFIAYHEQRAMLWERQALLRARPVAGDPVLGAGLVAELDPIRYPRRLPRGAAAEIDRLRQRMEREIAGAKPGTFHLKASRGGLADVELSVQYLLMRHAGRYPALRVTGTFAAIAALADAGFLSARRARRLHEGYTFLRRLESRVRMARDSAAEVVDVGHPATIKLARRMGYRKRPLEQLRRDIGRIGRSVRGLYDQIIQPELRP